MTDMEVRVIGGETYSGVQHIHARSGGDLVLRFAGSKTTIPAAEHTGYQVTAAR
jgi:hypothetical protein